MPRHIAPMLALLSDVPPDEQSYGVEYKWDGVRTICFWDGRKIRLESRNLLDITHRYPELWKLGDAIKHRSAILDGEVIALDEKGRPTFSLLQRRMHVAQLGTSHRQIRIVYMLFDLLYLDGGSTMELPYRKRRELLEKLKLAGESWQTPPYHVGGMRSMLASAEKCGLEGIVAKRLNSTYQPGRRSRDWLKIKVKQRREFVIGGWTPGEGAHKNLIGSLLVGYYERPRDGSGKPRLRYAGGVGTGLTYEDHLMLLKLLEKRRRVTSPFADPVPKRNAIWVKPDLVVEVEFHEWTPDGMLRHPSYKGLRFDKKATQVVRENVT